MKKPPTGRQLQILRLIAGGYTDLEIAEELDMAVGTVRSHNRNLILRLCDSDHATRAHAVSIAYERGLLP